jgi:hypothetical protein
MRIFDEIDQIKVSMDVRLNSKTHLQQTLSGVFEPLRATLALKFAKK